MSLPLRNISDAKLSTPENDIVLSLTAYAQTMSNTNSEEVLTDGELPGQPAYFLGRLRSSSTNADNNLNQDQFNFNAFTELRERNAHLLKKTLSDQDMGFIIALEEELHNRLIKAHGGRVDDVPVQYVDVVDGILDQVEEMLRH